MDNIFQNDVDLFLPRFIVYCPSFKLNLFCREYECTLKKKNIEIYFMILRVCSKISSPLLLSDCHGIPTFCFVIPGDTYVMSEIQFMFKNL